MRLVYIHSSYTPNDLIGNWFTASRDWARNKGGDAFFAIKFTHRKVQADDIQIGDSISCGIHAKMFDYFGLQDFFSWKATREFLKKLDEIKPDVIHCHVVNDCFLHIGLFCKYVNKHHIKVIWTFHDARALTGMCPCPAYCNCNQWMTRCKRCHPEYKFLYPAHPLCNLASLVHWYRKHTIGNIKNLIIVTPSKWMASLVAKSYLKDKRCEVINNGINLNVFHPVENDVRKKYNIPQDAKMLLSVGNPIWHLKGREYMHRLIKELPENYFIVMVGCIQKDLDKFKTYKNVLAFPRVDRDELMAFYSSADLFVNPTLADNFPTVNLESQACGTPVVAFNTDGTVETVAHDAGIIVPQYNYEALKTAILNFEYEGAREKSIRYAKLYDQNKTIKRYIQLYGF